MAVDHYGLASLAKLLAIVRTALRQHPHLVKDARASPVRGCSNFAHSAIFKRPHVTVNCPNGQVFPIRNSVAAAGSPISTAANPPQIGRASCRERGERPV